MGEAKARRGSLHQPHAVAAASCSIPTRYQTIVINNSEKKKGFCSQAKRFTETFSDMPGPGTYSVKEDIPIPSFGKRGTGGFASRSSRMPRTTTKRTPNPTSYNLHRNLTDRSDFSQSNSSSFQKPIASDKKYSVTRMPGPNQYNTTKAYNKLYGQNSDCNAAFKSRTKRTLDDISKSIGSNLSPAQYQTQVLNESTAVTSCFRSKTERKLATNYEASPGPGAYHPAEDNKSERQPQMPFRKHFLTISAPAMPMPPTPPAPGPGSYELVNFQDPKRKFMDSAVFKSGSSRWMGPDKQKDQPGPGSYEPNWPTKQSYLYNFDKRWLPV